MPYRRMTLLELSTNMLGRKGTPPVSAVDPMPVSSGPITVDRCGAITKTWSTCLAVLKSSGMCPSAHLHGKLAVFPNLGDTSMDAIRRWAEIATYHGIPADAGAPYLQMVLNRNDYAISTVVAVCVAQHRKELNRG